MVVNSIRSYRAKAHPGTGRPCVCAHQYPPEGDERATPGIRDYPCVLRRSRPFCARRLLPGVLASEAARRARVSWLVCIKEDFSLSP